jgi:hypothetical protein
MIESEGERKNPGPEDKLFKSKQKQIPLAGPGKQKTISGWTQLVSIQKW